MPTSKEQFREVAKRMKELREVSEISVEDMAKLADVTVDEYEKFEAGTSEVSFTFIYKCAKILRVDPTDLLEGVSPTLSLFDLTRKGCGIPINRREGFKYLNLAPMFKNKVVDPYVVTIPYKESLLSKPIKLGNHSGQELDIIISGSLKIQIADHISEMSAGDTIYYNGTTPHGMIATGGEDCLLYSICIQNDSFEPVEPEQQNEPESKREKLIKTKCVGDKFVITKYDKNDILQNISFRDDDKFNFAFDVIDELAKKCPNKTAMLHISKDHEERRFSFSDMSRYANMTANYFESLGIKRGDKVMLVLRRHYQFWFSMLALHKIGAIAVPAAFLLKDEDYEYRFKEIGVSAIVASSYGDITEQIDAACKNTNSVKTKIIVDGTRDGWHDFDTEMKSFSDKYDRKTDSPCGDDIMLMYFTSGTSGYPKAATHNYKYPLGHYVTARCWQNTDPDGLHLTISDTGWAKAAWGKIYGQWLTESGLFVYDFDRFDANDILPMFAKYHITTFCAPPTMYRFFIREDLSKFDLSSIEHCCIAGEALNPEVYEQWKKHTGLKLMEGFGQTESTCIIYNPVGTTPKPGSMGKPNPLYDVHIIDPDGNDCPAGETGEIVIDTSHGAPDGLCIGYFEHGKLSRSAWDKNGYYHTGDTAWMDEDGYIWYVGRTDDVIKSSGYRIGPFEIESVLMELPYVLECAVTAAPDPIRGQVVKATIILVKGTVASDDLKKEIQIYVKEHTAPYKYPRIVEFVDDLPKTTSGKIQRNVIRDRDNPHK